MLFDCGASHSFISIKCVKQLGLDAIPLQSTIVATTTIDNSMKTKWICEIYSVSIDGHE